MTRIALATDGNDWHARALGAAFAALGASVVRVRLDACGFATTHAHGLDLPGFADELPDAVLARTIAGGSFEEVTRRLGVLHALTALGVPVWNEARAIERCVDKSMTSFLLARAGVPTPETWTVEGAARARAVVASGGEWVLKPLFGAQGQGLRRIATPDELPAPDAVAGVYHLQRYVPPAGEEFRDHRVFVCNGEILAAMTRRGASWITNVKQGGVPEPLLPDREMAAIALRAAAAVGAAYAGVDLIRDAGGQVFVLEVNSMPAWRGLQRVTDVNVALRLAGAVLAAASGRSGAGAA
ncbi:MAG TPA: RimK family alpha-L-glutamate ligase [Acetobacteraceae bacterium]|nr:RimK family alpha-L-glutamate ligase [Acetobacteraceae bacterium]